MELAVQAGQEAGRVFQIDRPLMIVGRQVGTEIQVNDSQVSRRHLQLENRSGTLYVTDLGSANGSYINGRKIAPNQTELLRPGDNLRVGDTNLVLRGVAAPSSSTAATNVAGSYQAATQVQAPPPNQPFPSPPAQPDYYNNNSGNGSSGYPPQSGYNAAQPFANTPPQPGYPNQSSYPNQPASYNQPAQNYNAQPGYQPVQPGPAGYNPPNQAYQPTPGPFVPPVLAPVPKKNRGGLFAVLAVLAIAILGGGLFGLTQLLGNSSKPTPTAQVVVIPSGTSTPSNSTPGPFDDPGTVTPATTTTLASTPKAGDTTVAATVANNVATVAPSPVQTTVARGSSGNNLPPPSPPKPTTAPPTTVAATPKPTATGSSNNSGSLVPVKALGMSISFPANWKAQTDTTKNQIVAEAPDAATFVELAKTTSLTGAIDKRATQVLDNFKSKHTDLVITKQLATDSKGRAVVEYEYTDDSGSTSILIHERMAAFADPNDDTTSVFVFYSTNKDLFLGQDANFQAIANSIAFTS